VRDVTLREFGQNVPASALAAFLPHRQWLAERLITAGMRVLEVASTASPKVAPAMATAHLRPFLESLGHPAGVELITLVPNSKGYRRFRELGLGPEGLGHQMGLFLSAVNEHNVANLGRTTAESMADLRQFVPAARREGIAVQGYLSAAFGYEPPGAQESLKPTTGELVELIEQFGELGVASVTLSDLQGLATTTETAATLNELLHGAHPAPLPLGYHPHHRSPARALDNLVAAAEVGICHFDASLGAVGGCVTGAPGNAPTEGTVARLRQAGWPLPLDAERLDDLARQVNERVYRPVAEALRSAPH
jgi:hydroxymethylglutaryl-CoA lyase